MRARRSEIWAFFNKAGNYDTTREVLWNYPDCRFPRLCSSGNTTNMESHLRHYHFDDAYQEYQAAKDAAAELAAQRRPLRPVRRPREQEQGTCSFTFNPNNFYLLINLYFVNKVLKVNLLNLLNHQQDERDGRTNILQIPTLWLASTKC